MDSAVTDPLMALIIAEMIGHGVFIHTRGTVPGWLQAITWGTLIPAMVYITAESANLGTRYAGLFLFAFVLLLIYRLGSEPGPGAPEAFAELD